MAYTFNDFLGAANSSKMLGRFSNDDLKIAQNKPEYGLAMLRLYQDYDGAVSPEAQLLTQTVMDQLRSSYGADGATLSGLRLAPYDQDLMMPSAATTPVPNSAAAAGSTRVAGGGYRTNVSVQPAYGAGGKSPTVKIPGVSGAHSTAPGVPENTAPTVDVTPGEGANTTIGSGQTVTETVQAPNQQGNLPAQSATQQIPTTVPTAPEYNISAPLDPVQPDSEGQLPVAPEQEQQAAAGVLQELAGYPGFSYAGQPGHQEAIDGVVNYGGFTYENEDAYKAAMGGIVSPGDFQYSEEQAYRDKLDAAMNPGRFQYGNEQGYRDSMGKIQNYGDFSSDRTAQKDAALDAYLNGDPFAYVNAEQKNQMLQDALDHATTPYENEALYQMLLQQAASGKGFSYNPNTDPGMQAYRRAYLREGQRAAADALGQVAAATGGVPSSYATQAAQQAAGYYAAKLADKVPELEQQAYNRYLNEQAQKLQVLGELRADRADKYGMDQDAYNRKLTNYELLSADEQDAYQKYLDSEEKKVRAYEMLSAEEAADYEKWLNSFNQYLTQHQLIGADREDAYQKWLNEYNQSVDALNMISADRADAFEKWMTKYQMDLNAYETLSSDRADSYNKWQDGYDKRLDAYQISTAERDQAYQKWKDEYGILASNYEMLSAEEARKFEEWLVKEQLRREDEAKAVAEYAAGGVSEEEKAVLAGMYPDGVVTTQEEWDDLLQDYTEEQLAELGLVLQLPDDAGTKAETAGTTK